MITFFVVQSLGGIILYFGLSLTFLKSIRLISIRCFIFSIVLKLGIRPLFFWLIPVVFPRRNWGVFRILILKKIPLIILISKLINLWRVFVFLGLITGVQGALIGLNFTFLKSLLVRRRLGNMGWLLYRIQRKNLFLFFGIYSLCIGIILVRRRLKDSTLLLYFISLRSIPPLYLFWPKLSIRMSLLQRYQLLPLFLLLARRVISLVFYLKYSLSLSSRLGKLRTDKSKVLRIIGLGSFLLIRFI